jgi:Domain of unknown function (DUF4349)
MQFATRSRFFSIARWFGALFILMFAFRLLYGYLTPVTTQNSGSGDNFFSNLTSLRKNYASEKYQQPTGMQAAASSQKFEKTASIKSKTASFDNDEKKIKATTRYFNAVIQYEQSVGQSGSRQNHLMIGVNPSLFDSFYVAVQAIGTIKATEITKVDKTNEYRQLNAKKASLEKTLQSLNELKSKSGQISDYVALNDKILEIEEKLQELGVELGNFDTENEFCTVRFSLYEGAAERGISFIHRVKVALEWTIKYYALLVFSLLGLTALVLALLRVIDLLSNFNK